MNYAHHNGCGDGTRTHVFLDMSQASFQLLPPRSMPMFLFVRKHGNAGPALAEISPLCVRRSPVPALEPPEGFEPSSMRITDPPFCRLNYGGMIGITNCISYAIINWRREERCHRNSPTRKRIHKEVSPVFELYLAFSSFLIAAIGLLYDIEDKMDARRARK